MKKVFVPNLKALREIKEPVVNDDNYYFEVKEDLLSIGIIDSGKKNKMILIFIDEIENMNISIDEQYSILNELLEPFKFGLRYSKKEL